MRGSLIVLGCRALTRMRARSRDESGAVVILVAMALVAFLGLAALALDTGVLYNRDRELHTAADAGALAGALELIYSGGLTGSAESLADDYIDTNAAGSGVAPENFTRRDVVADARSVTVDLTEGGVPFFFARALGVDSGTVSAHAKAAVMYVVGISKLFPVAINYMDPEVFRFVVRNGAGTEVTRFEIGKTDDSGTYATLVSGGSYTPTTPGLYSIDLQAIDEEGDVGVELPGVGLWRVADPTDPEEKLYRVGMFRDVGDATITVRILVAPTVTDASIRARLGNSNFDLFPQGGGVYQGSVTAPTQTGNEGWQTYDLKIQSLTGNDSVGRYVALHPDVPLRYLMFQPAYYDGYSGVVGQNAAQRAALRVRVLTFGSTYTMKLGNQAGSGLYSGNWRIADVYREPNTTAEIGTVPIPDSWTLNYPLRIGGPLRPEPGASVGQIRNGLSDRLSGHSPSFTISELQTLPLGTILERMPSNDPYFVIIPIVEFTEVHGASIPYKIADFAGFYITSWSKAGDIEGVFIRWAASGDWTDEKPGDVYIETAVLTE